MNKIGVALSGGGFRASLYHVALVRFLRDAGILPQVTHVTSVSGGSVVAAQLLDLRRYAVEVEAETGELCQWFLLPTGRSYRNFQIVRYATDEPASVEAVNVVSEYLADDFAILAFKLLSAKPGCTYEIQWLYK
jgi:hypothetical protein